MKGKHLLRDLPKIKLLFEREQRPTEGQTSLSARYAALVQNAAHIWEVRKAERRREEIYAIVDELLEHADEDLKAYAQRRCDGNGWVRRRYMRAGWLRRRR